MEVLDWDNTIGERLPGTKFANEQIASITLRELATHTSGLPTHSGQHGPT